MAQGQNTANILGFLGSLLGSYADSSTKPGFKKTEFWLTALATVASFVPVVGGPYGPIIGGLLTLGYTALRSYVTAKADANKSGSVVAAVSTAPAAVTAAVINAQQAQPPGRM